MDATNSHLTAEQAALWAGLTAFDLDAASVTLPFSKRLQRETGWSRAFTLRAMAEYKKFVFLGKVTYSRKKIFVAPLFEVKTHKKYEVEELIPRQSRQ